MPRAGGDPCITPCITNYLHLHFYTCGVQLPLVAKAMLKYVKTNVGGGARMDRDYRHARDPH